MPTEEYINLKLKEHQAIESVRAANALRKLARKDLFQLVSREDLEAWIKKNNISQWKNPIIYIPNHGITSCELKFGKLWIWWRENDPFLVPWSDILINFHESYESYKY